MEESIKARLGELPDSELLELQYAIKHILDERGISEEAIISAVEKLYGQHGGLVRYTDLVIYLEGAGFKREAINKRIVEMVKKYPHFAHGGCPIGEEETLERPIYPTYEGVRYANICYVKPKWSQNF